MVAVAVFFIAQAAAGPSSNKSTKTAKKTAGVKTESQENLESTSSARGGAITDEKTTKNKVQIPVLAYHYVSYYSGKDPVMTKLHVSPTNFSAQIKYLSKNGYSVLSLDDAYDILFNDKKAPNKPVVLTFNDGYSDFYKNAFPILKSYKFTASIFIISQKPGEDGFLSWQQIKNIAGAGFEIGSQSFSNPDLTKLGNVRVGDEIKLSKSDISGEINRQVKYFAYPFGLYNSSVTKTLSKSGYFGGLTLNGVNASSGQGQYALSRKIVDGRFSIDDFAKLLK